MNTTNSNEIEFWENAPLAEVLVSENIGDLSLKMTRVPDGNVWLEICYSGELMKISNLNNISDFQAGRVYQYERAAYSKILKG